MSRRFATVTLALSLAGCATTGAYVQTHPDSAEAIEIATVAVNCVDHAVAGVVLETPWQPILVDALGCVSQLVLNQLLKPSLEQPAREAVYREVTQRQDRSLQRYRAMPKSDSKELSLEAVPSADMAAGYSDVTRIGEPFDLLLSPYSTVTWEERIAVPQEDAYCGH